jgi:hypothetical protein
MTAPCLVSPKTNSPSPAQRSIHAGAAKKQIYQSVVAIDAVTGKDVWKVDRASDGRGECLNSCASPTIWVRDRQARLVTHGNDYATAPSLADGKAVWRTGDLNPKAGYNSTQRFVASPVAVADLSPSPRRRTARWWAFPRPPAAS